MFVGDPAFKFPLGSAAEIIMQVSVVIQMLYEDITRLVDLDKDAFMRISKRYSFDSMSAEHCTVDYTVIMGYKHLGIVRRDTKQ